MITYHKTLSGKNKTRHLSGVKPLRVESLESRTMLSADAWVASTGIEAGPDSNVAVDSSGSVYLSVTEDGSSAPTNQDIALRKYSADGSTEVWTLRLPANGADRVHDLAVAPSGNHLYIVGSFDDTNPFDPSATSYGASDIYLAKVSSFDGSIVWFKTWGASSSDSARSVDVIGDNVYLTGVFRNTVNFDGSSLESDELGSAFVLKVNGIDGSVAWAEQSTGQSSADGISVAASTTVAGAVDVAISGLFSGQVQFGQTTLLHNESCGNFSTCHETFVAQLESGNAAASFSWAKDLDAGNDPIYPPSTDVVTSGGGLFVIASPHILRIDGSTATTTWAKQFGSPAAGERLNSITVDAGSNTAFIAGEFKNSADFGGGTILTSNGSSDGFIARYAMDNGNVTGAQSMGGSRFDSIKGLVARNGSLYASGKNMSTDAAYPVLSTDSGTSAFRDISLLREAAVMKMDPAAPIVNISLPEADSVFDEAEIVTLTGATSTGTIQWTSSLDGPVGTGSSIITSTLSPGRHQITASATDSAARTGSAGTVLYVRPSVSPNDIPLPLADAKGNKVGVTTSTVTIPSSTTIEDLDVYVDVDHTRIKQLDITLISPSGTRVDLVGNMEHQVGTSVSDFQLYFDDEASRSISPSESSPFAGRFRPEAPSLLSEFDGEEAAGSWVLEVRDDTRQHTGTLNDWFLIVNGEVQNPSAPPMANAGLDQSVQEDMTAIFDGSGSSDPEGDSLTYLWDFGDGQTATGVAPSHTFLHGGLFTVTLTVNDGNGNEDIDTVTVTVGEENDVPVADPSGPYSAQPGGTVLFDASMSFDFDNSDATSANDQSLTYIWDFGDGSSAVSTLDTVSHTYLLEGEYNVELTVDDGVATSTPATTVASIRSSITHRAIDEALIQGTLDGSLTDTLSSDDAYEQITEELYAGNKRSRVEHQWEFNVASGSSHSLTVEAHHNSANEDFVFEYSVDGGQTWIFLFEVTANVDQIYTANLDSGLSGTILVRARDTDRSRGDNTSDTLFVDDMFITTTP